MKKKYCIAKVGFMGRVDFVQINHQLGSISEDTLVFKSEFEAEIIVEELIINKVLDSLIIMPVYFKYPNY